MGIRQDASLQATFSGMLAAFVGFAGSFAVVLQGLNAVGATPAQSSSSLMALSVSMGICGIWLSLRYRMPIAVAWSTPGAAMLASSAAVVGGFNEAVGGFIVCSLLLILTGLFRPLSKLIAAIPTSLASAMLAGVLFGLCLAPVKAIADYPYFGLAIFMAWLLGGRLNKLLSVPAALLALIVIIFFFIDSGSGAVAIGSAAMVTKPEFVKPVFTVVGVLSIGLPLYIVTMASQNIPGVGVLNANRYQPNASSMFTTSGFFSLLAAPFGGHAVNLAAITAAICAGEDAHPNPDRRYWSAVVAGLCYVFAGVFAVFITSLIFLAPPILIQAVAGYALISACAAAFVSAFEKTEHRDSSAVTFFTTASALSFFGISGAFWGLLAGWLVYEVKSNWFNTKKD